MRGPAPLSNAADAGCKPGRLSYEQTVDICFFVIAIPPDHHGEISVR